MKLGKKVESSVILYKYFSIILTLCLFLVTL